MGAPKGNTYGKGNRGGGRKSAFEEFQDASWQAKLWEIDQMVLELQAKIQSRKYSARDMFALKCLTGEERMLKTLADKMLPDAVDLKGLQGILPTPILNVFYNNGHEESGQPQETDQSSTGGNVRQ